MTLAVLSGFIIAFVLLISERVFSKKFYKWLAVFPLLLFTYFISLSGAVQKTPVWSENSWVPQAGISLNFKLDGLSLLFSLLITGIGALIFLYTSSYLKGHPYLNRFYSYLSLFMSSMLGVVLSDNILTLFIFWELTSFSSYFLIGFNHNDSESRKSAVLALSITGIGGLFLLSGGILLGNISGTLSIHEMVNQAGLIKDHSLYALALVFIFGGAFTKSAQVPFYSWLPAAMKAPTPVSAYLHSATMVKAGVYLLARMSPALGGTFLWQNTLMIVGGVTMLYAAFHAILRMDLKEILAYSTVSALGVMVLLIGIGTPYAFQALSVFILVHALYKAALFMTTGAIEHTVSTRSLNQLSGLRKIAPSLALAGFLAAVSSAGIPFTIGFIGKDLIYEAALHFRENFASVLTAVLLATNALLLCAGFLAGIKPFAGEYVPTKQSVAKQDKILYLPPLILGVLGIFAGIFPGLFQKFILEGTAQSVSTEAIFMQLKLWPGFNLILLLSLVTLVLGTLLYFLRKSEKLQHDYIQSYRKISSQYLIDKIVEDSRKFAHHYTKFMQSGYLRIYALVIIVFLTVTVSIRLLLGVPMQFHLQELTPVRVYDLIVFGIVVVATGLTVATHSRLSAIVSLGIIGYSISLIFVFYGAPDLAMTQFAIDTLTVVLFVLVLFKLPTYIKQARRSIQLRDLVVSVAFGTLIAAITLQALIYPADKEISSFFAENSYLLAKGKNVVNVILVDFRGFDTMIETIVLSISAIGVYGLLKYKASASEGKIQQ